MKTITAVKIKGSYTEYYLEDLLHEEIIDFEKDGWVVKDVKYSTILIKNDEETGEEEVYFSALIIFEKQVIDSI